MTNYSEFRAKEHLGRVIGLARKAISRVSDAYSQDWKENPSTEIRAALGYWVVCATRHFAAITILCEEHDLSMVADTHYRQMLEIQLQIRFYVSLDKSIWERTAQKISAYGCIDYLEKLESIMDHPNVQHGYQEVESLLENFDKDLIDSIRSDRAKRIWYWFGKSFSNIADKVSRNGEDLKTLYQIQSADLHGSWGLTLGVSNPKPGSLDFRDYPDKATMYRWAADSLDLATQTYISIWNDVARNVGAPSVDISSIAQGMSD